MANFVVDLNGNISVVRNKEKEDEKKKKKKAAYSVDLEGNITKLEQEIDEELAPVKKTTSEKEEEERTWFQAPAFDDGYQFGDVLKTVIGTGLDVGTGLIEGVSTTAEGIFDLGAHLVGYGADLVGADSFAKKAHDVANKNDTQELFDSIRLGNPNDDYSVLGEKSRGVTNVLGQIATMIATAGVGSAAGLGKGAVTALTSLLMGTSSAGSGMSEAYNAGATDGEAAVYGTVKGVIDAGTEMIFGGLGKFVNAKGLSYGISSLDDVAARALSEKVTGKIVNETVKRWVSNAAELGVKASAEGLEEVLAGAFSAVAKKFTYQTEKDFGEIIKDENLLEQFVVGAVASGFAQAPGYVSSSKAGRDFVTGRNTNEEIVFQKEVENRIAAEEADGKKLTDKQKAEIEKEVEADLEKGRISADTIESVLGGDAYTAFEEGVKGFSNSEDYKAYQDAVAEEKAIQEEFEALQNMKAGEATIGQQDRYNELKSRIEEFKTKSRSAELRAKLEPEIQRINALKSQLRTEVEEKVKGDRLSEAYREMRRSKEKFQADPAKYENEYARKTIQNLIDGGIANNTKEFHEFADFMAKMSADKGLVFDLTDNKKLAGTRYEVKGATVNAYVTKDGNVVLNKDSKKRLNSLVGHEITHVLEGTKFYNELANAVKDYAVKKGEYDTRLQAVTELYQKYNPEADPVKELTADLVGDYIFTDKAFIENLSVNHRNIFQWLSDEIKYLAKIATAGSKEARALEKAKKVFADVYRASGQVKRGAAANSDAKVQNSISEGKDGTSRQLTAEQQEFFKDSVVRDENGNLKVMYHGTSKGGHTVFDPYGAARYGLFGLGTYFTDSRTIAESYTKKGKGDNPQVYETYLNITNPMDMDAPADPAAWAKVFPDADFPASGTNEDFYRAMEEYFEDMEYVRWEAHEAAMDAIMSMGYDGITHIGGGRVNADGERHQVYIAFQPEQIKAVDNAKPTDAADIRFSLSEDTDGRYGDAYSRAYDMRVEENKLTREIAEFEKTDEFKAAMAALSKAIDSGDIDGGVKAYQKWRVESGYEEMVTKRDTLRQQADGLMKVFEEEVADKAKDSEKTAIEKSGLGEAEYFQKQAVKEFGYTPFFYDAGYITPNGKMLNFSGEKGKHFGSRGQDHRAIGTIYADTQGSDALVRFMNAGNVRIMAESPGIDISAEIEPSKEQYSTIRRFINEYADKGYFSVDLSGTDGRVVGTLEYENRINATRIINDIKHYYETGEIREQSGVDRFRFSLSEETVQDSKGRQLTDAQMEFFADPDIRRSLSDDGVAPVRGRGYAVYGENIRVRDPSEFDFAPVADGVRPEGTTKKGYIGIEDFANPESSVWRNVAYEDEATKSDIMKSTHVKMVEDGAVVKIADEVTERVGDSFPDLRGVKKKERTPILKEKIGKLKAELRRFLNGFKNQNFEFDVDGKVLEAKLYNTGIDEVLEKVTQEKASMLYTTEAIFKNARYLYSTPDYGGDANVYRWNYFYTPVQIGDDIVGVRIAVRDLIKGVGMAPESQIYNWGIKKDTSLDGGRRGHKVASSGVSSDVSTGIITPEENFVKIENDKNPVQMQEDFAPATEADAIAASDEAFGQITEEDIPPEREAPLREPPMRSTTTIDEKSLKKIANEVGDELYLNRKGKKEIGAIIQKYAQGEISEAKLFEEFKEYATYEEDAPDAEILQEIRHHIRGVKLAPPKSLRSDVDPEGFERFKKRNFGRFQFKNGAIPVDSYYMELSGLWPGFFPEDRILISEQLQQLEAFWELPLKVRYPLPDEAVRMSTDKAIRAVNRYIEGESAAYANEMLTSLSQTDEFVPPIPEDIAPEAPVAPVAPVEDNTPAKEEYEAIRPEKPKRKTANRLVRVDNVTTEQRRIAEVLDAEPGTTSRRQRIWAKVRANFLDKGSVFEDLALKTKKRELMGKWNYMLYSEARAQRLMGSGADGVKSLNAIIEEVGKTGKTKQFYEYLYHVHNADRMTLADRYEDMPNKAVFDDSVTAEVSREAIKQYEAENPNFKRFAQDVYAYNDHLRALLVEGGVISQETADLWAEMYPHYVPIRRVGDTGLNINVPLDTGRTTVNAPVKRATGGNSDILPLFDTMAQRTLQTYRAIAKNSFGVELKNALGTTISNEQTGVDDLIESIEAQDGLLQEGKNGRNPTFTVFENGERVTFEIDEDMYDALKPMSEGLAYTNKVLNTATNFHRGLLTEYNPVFMLTNAIKDVQDILINSQHAAKTYAKIPEAFAQLVKKGYWYSEYMANGGEQNSYFDNETNTFKTENKGIKKLLDLPPLSTISKLNNFIEMVPRLAEYIASREAGRSVEVSMLDAARVTTNFRAGGDITKFLNRNGATFLNASVQGAMQQIRNVREANANGVKGWVNLATKFALAGIPALILNGLLWDDDEEYEELSDYVKQNYYIVAKTGEGKFIRIPKGRALAVIQDTFDLVSDAVTGDDEVDLARFLELGAFALTNLGPNNPIENNILSPIIQVANNKTWYGEDLVPQRLQDLPAAEQFDESTDEISKWLGGKLNISPVKINYLLDQYSGGVGDVVLPMLTPEAESGDNTVLGNLFAPLKSKFTADSVMNNQNVSDFYDTMDELTTAAKKGDATDEDVLKSKYMNSVNAELSALYKEKRAIQNSDFSADVKYEMVRKVQEKIVALTKEALDAYEEVDLEESYGEVGDRNFRWYQKEGAAEGEWRKITDKELEKQYKVTRALGISADDYWGNKEEYDFAYEYPEKYRFLKDLGITVDEYQSFGDEAKDAYSWAAENPDGYTVSKAVLDDLPVYRRYVRAINGLKADKDASGKTISGSAKEKKINYINSLDLDYGAKLILFKNEYKADDTYNYEIVNYLNERDDITAAEMITILKELGFEVDAEGNISW